MTNKLGKKEIFISVLTFITWYAILVLTMFLMLTLNSVKSNLDVIGFIGTHYQRIVTVCISAAILVAIVYAYLFFENKHMLAHGSKIAEIYLLVCIALLACDAVSKFLAVTASPLIFFALMSSTLFRRRDAIFFNTIFALHLFIFNRFLNDSELLGGYMPMVESFANLLTVYCGGAIAVFVMKNIKSRIGCVMIALVVFIPVLIINIVMQLPVSTSLDWRQVLDISLYCVLDCVFSVLLFMFILPVFEMLFSELTVFRLRELTSDSAKLIKMLRINAQGTYNHSMVVAQLAEACAGAIGEDPELARACAYYHDVGKLKSPEMFTENQSEYDMHKELTPELSVDIIRAHAKDGAKLIKKNRLPEIFADVAIQHHGTMPIKYFYAKALKMSDGEINPANYSYGGPTPTSKIAAIIMIADASEAATRSLSDRSTEKVEELVRSLVEERMNLDQFVDCDITMRELSVIISTLVNRLTGVYHSRVQYPKLVLSKRK